MEVTRVIARNTAPDSENRMHDDHTAAEYGFRGGLVPGVAVYGYMATQLGREFLESGGMSLRLLQPFYDGDEVQVVRDGQVIEARSNAGAVHATGLLRTTPVPDLLGLEYRPLPALRPQANAESLAPGIILGSIRRTLDSPTAEALLELANRVLMANVELTPWIHAASEVQHYSAPTLGEEVTARARVLDNFERKGHRLVLFEVAVAGSDGRLIQHVRHTAIYAPRRASAQQVAT